MTDSDDRTEAPVSNEELYVEIKKTNRLFVLATALVFAGLAYVALAAARPEVGEVLGGALILFALMYWGLFKAFEERGWASALFDLVPGIDVGETSEELEDRLVSEEQAVADGGEEP